VVSITSKIQFHEAAASMVEMSEYQTFAAVPNIRVKMMRWRDDEAAKPSEGLPRATPVMLVSSRDLPTQMDVLDRARTQPMTANFGAAALGI
jgi:hypothetical protein